MQHSIQTIVTIIPFPIAFAGLDQEWTCSSKQSSLMALDTASNALNFEWTTQNGNISSSPNNAQINVSNFGTYFLKVTNPKNGCVAFDQVTIKPNLNKPSIALQKPPDLTCITTMVNLTSNGSATGSQYQYTWSTINGSLSGATNPILDFSFQKAFYILTIIDTSNQCISMDSIFVDENIVKPIVDAGLDQVIGCKITTLILLQIQLPKIKKYGPLSMVISSLQIHLIASLWIAKELIFSLLQILSMVVLHQMKSS